MLYIQITPLGYLGNCWLFTIVLYEILIHYNNYYQSLKINHNWQIRNKAFSIFSPLSNSFPFPRYFLLCLSYCAVIRIHSGSPRLIFSNKYCSIFFYRVLMYESEYRLYINTWLFTEFVFLPKFFPRWTLSLGRSLQLQVKEFVRWPQEHCLVSGMVTGDDPRRDECWTRTVN